MIIRKFFLVFGLACAYIVYMELDFEIDKITESIEVVRTGEHFETSVVPVAKADLKEINGWNFDWDFEFSQPKRQLYKLITEKEPAIIQGLVSFEILEKDGLVQGGTFYE